MWELELGPEGWLAILWKIGSLGFPDFSLGFARKTE
jgi:hypothetical protein